MCTTRTLPSITPSSARLMVKSEQKNPEPQTDDFTQSPQNLHKSSSSHCQSSALLSLQTPSHTVAPTLQDGQDFCDQLPALHSNHFVRYGSCQSCNLYCHIRICLCFTSTANFCIQSMSLVWPESTQPFVLCRLHNHCKTPT